jgi:hypothetical protein
VTPVIQALARVGISLEVYGVIQLGSTVGVVVDTPAERKFAPNAESGLAVGEGGRAAVPSAEGRIVTVNGLRVFLIDG